MTCTMSVKDNHLFVVSDRDKAKASGGYTLRLNLEDCKIGPTENTEGSEGSLLHIFSRSRGSSVTSRRTGRSVGSRDERYVVDESTEMRFDVVNSTDQTTIGIRGTKVDGLLELRKILKTSQITAKAMTSNIDPKHIVEGDLIGIGGAAKIYAGTYFGMPVAIKKFHEINQRDVAEVEESLKRQVDELMNLQALRHPNVVSVVGAFLSGHVLSVMMERCDRSLEVAIHEDNETSLDEMSWSLERFIRVVGGIAEGMSYIHARDIVHRDLKPANILLTPNFLPKITDFGDSRKRATRMSINIGTPIYHAPEQIAMDRALYKSNKKVSYGKPVDVYAFALIVWEMWTRHVPFYDMKNMSAIEKFVSEGGRPNVGTTESIVFPTSLEFFIRQCWAQRPAARPSFRLIKKQWSVQFGGKQLLSMFRDGSARPWFLNPTSYRDVSDNMIPIPSVQSPPHSSSSHVHETTPSEVGLTTQTSSVVERSSEVRRISTMACEELSSYVKQIGIEEKHRGLVELSELILTEDIDGPEILTFDMANLEEIGLYNSISSDRRREKKRKNVLDLIQQRFQVDHGDSRRNANVTNLESDTSASPASVFRRLPERHGVDRISDQSSEAGQERVVEDTDEIDIVFSRIESDATAEDATLSSSRGNRTDAYEHIRGLSFKDLARRARILVSVEVADMILAEKCSGDDFVNFTEADFRLFGISKPQYRRILEFDPCMKIRRLTNINRKSWSEKLMKMSSTFNAPSTRPPQIPGMNKGKSGGGEMVRPTKVPPKVPPKLKPNVKQEIFMKSGQSLSKDALGSDEHFSTTMSAAVSTRDRCENAELGNGVVNSEGLICPSCKLAFDSIRGLLDHGATCRGNVLCMEGVSDFE